MSEFVLKAVLDGDVCTVLEDTPYSTNPRKFITIKAMLAYHRFCERVHKSLEEGRGA